MIATSADLHARTGRTTGNWSLMQTSPVALTSLDDPAGHVEAAKKVGSLTRHDPRAQ